MKNPHDHLSYICAENIIFDTLDFFNHPGLVYSTSVVEKNAMVCTLQCATLLSKNIPELVRIWKPICDIYYILLISYNKQWFIIVWLFWTVCFIVIFLPENK